MEHTLNGCLVNKYSLCGQKTEYSIVVNPSKKVESIFRMTVRQAGIDITVYPVMRRGHDTWVCVAHCAAAVY